MAHSELSNKSLVLAAIQAFFAVPYGYWGWRFGQIMGDVAGGPATTTREHVAVGAIVAFVFAGFLLCATSVIELVRAPQEAVRRLSHLRSLYVTTGILSALLAGFQAFRVTESALGMLVVAAAGVLLAFYAGRSARALSPREASPTGTAKRERPRPQDWWVAHQFANLLVLAPLVVYWGSFTRADYAPAGKMVFLGLVLLVGLRWSLHFVVVCVWGWNRPALAATWQRLAQPLRQVGFGIVALMLVQAGMAAAKDEVVLASAIGALAMGGLVSVLYIEPQLVVPAE